MSRGDTSKFTHQQIRRAELVKDSYLNLGFTAEEAAQRAWAALNRNDGGGETPVRSGRVADAGVSPGDGAADETQE